MWPLLLLSVRFLLYTDEPPRDKEQSSRQVEDHVVLPVKEPIRTEQQLAALKKKELELPERLIRDFPGRDDPLAIMGNVWYRRGNAAEAETFWRAALKANPKRADVCTSMGWLFLKKGDFGQAIAHYRKALEIEPLRPDVHLNIGRALMMSGRQDGAIKELERELQISPNSAFAFFLLGQVYQQRREYETAKKYYETAVKIDPDYANAYYGLTTVCANLGHRDEAREYSATFTKLKAEVRKDLKSRKIEYDDFAETQKSAAMTYINVGRMYRDNGRLQEAEEVLKQAAGLDPENVVGLLELASLYQDSNQPAKALQMHRRVSGIQPEFLFSYLFIGILSAQLERMDDAEGAFRKLIALAPRDSAGYRELARLYLKTRKDLRQARQLAEKAVALEPLAANYFVLAWACDENGDTANARPAIERAVEQEPTNQQYQRLYRVIQQRN